MLGVPWEDMRMRASVVELSSVRLADDSADELKIGSASSVSRTIEEANVQ